VNRPKKFIWEYRENPCAMEQIVETHAFFFIIHCNKNTIHLYNYPLNKKNIKYNNNILTIYLGVFLLYFF